MIIDEFKGTTKEADLASVCTLDALQCHLGVCTYQKGFPASSVVKNPPATAGGIGSIPGSGRSPGEENDNPLQHSGLGDPIDRGAQWTTVHGVARAGHDLVTKQQLIRNERPN